MKTAEELAEEIETDRAETDCDKEEQVKSETEKMIEAPVITPFGIPGDWRPMEIGPEEKSDEVSGVESSSVDGSENASELTLPTPSERDSSAPSAGANRVFRFQELMSLNIERPKDIVEGLVCERQNVLLMGRFGIGKTMFGTQLSLHLATGREFLGLKIPNPFRTLYLDFENDLGDIKERLSKQTSGLALTKGEVDLLDENWTYIDAGDPENPLHGIKLDDSHRGKFETLIARFNERQPEVVIIDNLGTVATKGDLTEAEDAARFYANLKYIRSSVKSLQNGANIVFHHLTKPGDTSSISLLTSPYEYLSRARGTGRVLDFARCRLALADEMLSGKKFYVVNGINRSANVSPLILQFNPETLSFDRHEDTKLRFDAVFEARSRGKEIYRLLPEEFRFSDVQRLQDPNTGKPLNKGTLSDTLKVAVTNDFIRHSPITKVYKKVFDPQSD